MSDPPHRLGFGVDMAAEKFDCAFGAVDDEGAFGLAAPPRSFPNTVAGIEACIAWCRRCLAGFSPEGPAARARIAVEATGVYHERFVDLTHGAGLRVCVVMPKSVRHYRLSKNVYTKTDRQDARLLCEFACVRKLEAWRPATANLLEIRALLRHRHAIVAERTAQLSRRHARDYATVDNAVLRAVSARQLATYDELVGELDAEARRLYRADEELRRRLDPIVASVPGVGWLTALTIVAETNAFSEVTSGKQLTSYAGLDVVENQSGQSAGRTRVSKRGNARLRRSLYMSALYYRRASASGPVAAFGRRIAARNPTASRKATVAIMRKLLGLVRTLWISGERYDPDYGTREDKREDTREAPAAGLANGGEAGPPESAGEVSPPRGVPRGDSPGARPGLREVVQPEPTPLGAKVGGETPNHPPESCTETQ